MSQKNFETNVYSYTVIYEPVSEGEFNVVIPAIPEICTFGQTLKEAREMAKDAIRCYLESALKSGEKIPQESQSFREPIREKIAITFP